jgi:hypothetical protein
MADTWTVARQVAFFPSVAGGKLHAANKISRTAVCGIAAELDSVAWVTVSQGQDSGKVAPMVCRRCLRATTRPGPVVATGVVQ